MTVKPVTMIGKAIGQLAEVMASQITGNMKLLIEDVDGKTRFIQLANLRLFFGSSGTAIPSPFPELPAEMGEGNYIPVLVKTATGVTVDYLPESRVLTISSPTKTTDLTFANAMSASGSGVTATAVAVNANLRFSFEPLDLPPGGTPIRMNIKVGGQTLLAVSYTSGYAGRPFTFVDPDNITHTDKFLAATDDVNF